MSYEIPQNLKYEEKIVFGLTAKQLFWLAIFVTPTIFIFLKTQLSFEWKILITILLFIAGGAFAFVGAWGKLKDGIEYLTSMRNAGYFDKKMEKFMDVQKIENNAVYTHGRMLAILQVLPISFDMLSESEQKAVIHSFKDFLNSLDFPIQIVMRTVDLNVIAYLRELENRVKKQNKQELLEQFESLKKFIEEYITDNKVKNRLFYVVIPVEKTKNEELDLNQLTVRVQLCKEKIQKAALLSKQLNDQELTTLLASFFEGFIEVENDYFSVFTQLCE
ncbi:MAG: PrgI family protein [Candidatus Diapherotrites archaeon]|nr:PrgI family protein [Candidatus Diapherotrites archaeon]